jgi:hypothetical protein
MMPVSQPPAPSETVTGSSLALKCVVRSAISTVRFNSRLICGIDGTTGEIRGDDVVVEATGIEVVVETEVVTAPAAVDVVEAALG